MTSDPKVNRNNNYIINLNNLIVYTGVREAERLTGIDHSNIVKACSGKRASAGGYQWAYFNPILHTNWTYAGV